MDEKTVQIRIAEIMVDETLYPRHKLSDRWIAQLKDAFIAGADIPPIILWEGKNILVDGQHRIEAKRRLEGEEAFINAVYKQFKTKRAMLEFAVSVNAVHGYKLTVWDQVRSLLLLLEMNTPEPEIAKALHVSAERIAKLKERIKEGPGDQKVAIKGGNKKLQDSKKLTEAQVAFEVGARSGMPLAYHLHQVIGALKAGIVEFDEKTVGLFDELIEAYEEAVA